VAEEAVILITITPEEQGGAEVGMDIAAQRVELVRLAQAQLAAALELVGGMGVLQTWLCCRWVQGEGVETVEAAVEEGEAEEVVEGDVSGDRAGLQEEQEVLAEREEQGVEGEV
jgi:hypothetical protein